jgi:thiamine biosynthesis lipoprotein
MSDPDLEPRPAPGPKKRRLPPRVVLGVALVAAMVLGVLLLRKPDYEPVVLEFQGETMGSTYQVKVVDPSAHPGTRQAMERGIAGELDLVNFTMSRFDPESELYRFNLRRDTSPFAMSEAAIGVIAAARLVSERTGGAYDVTIGPLMRLWGFWERRPRASMPSDAEIEAARAKVGWRLFEIDEKAHTLRKIDPDVEIDLGSIAPGAAVDRLANMFEAFDYENYMVEIAGEVRCHGLRPDRTPWRIGIENPVPGAREVKEIVELADTAMSTSGDYRQFYVIDGRRLSHTIDPRKGRPIAHGLASVSVIHEECMMADAWATALDVLGPDEGYAMAERDGLAALFIAQKPDGSLYERATGAFTALRRRQSGASRKSAD